MNEGNKMGDVEVIKQRLDDIDKTISERSRQHESFEKKMDALCETTSKIEILLTGAMGQYGLVTIVQKIQDTAIELSNRVLQLEAHYSRETDNRLLLKVHDERIQKIEEKKHMATGVIITLTIFWPLILEFFKTKMK